MARQIKNPLTKEAMYHAYDGACAAVYDLMEEEPDEQTASELEAMYLKLANWRDKLADSA